MGFPVSFWDETNFYYAAALRSLDCQMKQMGVPHLANISVSLLQCSFNPDFQTSECNWTSNWRAWTDVLTLSTPSWAKCRTSSSGGRRSRSATAGSSRNSPSMSPIATRSRNKSKGFNFFIIIALHFKTNFFSSKTGWLAFALLLPGVGAVGRSDQEVGQGPSRPGWHLHVASDDEVPANLGRPAKYLQKGENHLINHIETCVGCS